MGYRRAGRQGMSMLGCLAGWKHGELVQSLTCLRDKLWTEGQQSFSEDAVQATAQHSTDNRWMQLLQRHDQIMQPAGL